MTGPPATPPGGEAASALPSAYAAWRGSALGRITDMLEEAALREAIGPAAGRSILDVGCGDGALAVGLALEGAAATAVDRDPPAVEAARRRALDAKAPIRLGVAAAEALPFASGSFDAVVAVTVLCFVRDADVALGEMARVLRPGGRLVVGELGRWNAWAARRRIRGWLGSPVWRQAAFRTPATLRAMARRAGLVDGAVRGAVYYPPLAIAARLLRPIDHAVSRVTTAGAAFLVLSATKPAAP